MTTPTDEDPWRQLRQLADTAATESAVRWSADQQRINRTRQEEDWIAEAAQLAAEHQAEARHHQRLGEIFLDVYDRLVALRSAAESE